jgi:aminotransferase
MPESYYDGLLAEYTRKKQLFTEGLTDAKIPYTDPHGAYFVLADVAPFMKKGQSDVSFCEELAEKAGIACVPGTSFFEGNVNHIVRMHFAKKDETLAAAAERLCDIRARLGR